MSSPLPAESHEGPHELKRELSLLDSTMINVGSMIGSGIFIVPATIALQLQSTSLIAAVWVVGGIISLFGALAIAELGARMPKAGGQYVYLREAYGPLWGFLYGWAGFAVIQTAAIAALAVGFATYLGYFFPLSPVAIKVIGIASILLLTAANCLGTKIGAALQNAFTFSKIGAVLLLGFLALLLSGGSSANFSPVLPTEPVSKLLGPFSLAIIAVLWSYDGWIEITYVAGEVRNPERAIPRSLFLSTILVIGLYVIVNLAFVYVLSIARMSQSQLVASDTAVVLIGSRGADLIALAVMVSMFGANNGFIFTGARIYYAMAKEGLFFRRVASIHPKYGTPAASLVSQGVWSCVLVLSGTYDQLITYVVFVSWIFYAMSCGAVFILRQRNPSAPLPYRAWGYPWAPAVFILFAVALVVATIIQSPLESAIGVVLLFSGVPAYYYWKRRQK